MKYDDNDCINALENEINKLSSFCLIDTYEGYGNYSISVIRGDMLFDCLITDNELAFCCIEFLVRNGNPVYNSVNEFKAKNPDINC